MPALNHFIWLVITSTRILLRLVSFLDALSVRIVSRYCLWCFLVVACELYVLLYNCVVFCRNLSQLVAVFLN